MARHYNHLLQVHQCKQSARLWYMFDASTKTGSMTHKFRVRKLATAQVVQELVQEAVRG